MLPVLIRIGLRYGAATLVARGLLGADDAAAISSDPDIAMAIEIGIGGAIGIGTEVWHYIVTKAGLYAAKGQ